LKNKHLPKEIEKRFTEIITKVKKGILPEEKITAGLTDQLQLELKYYDELNLDVWHDSWKPDGIAFRYFNIVQMYKTKNDIYVRIHTELCQRSKVLEDDALCKHELNLGFDVRAK
jgi:hypothetical protein